MNVADLPAQLVDRSGMLVGTTRTTSVHEKSKYFSFVNDATLHYDTDGNSSIRSQNSPRKLPVTELFIFTTCFTSYISES